MLSRKDPQRFSEFNCTPAKIKRELQETLDDDVRRGVALEDCLEKFGTHWTGGIGALTKGKPEDLAKGQHLAKTVERIDDFLSHDWGTSGSRKFLTICLHYNGTAALIGGSVVASIFGVLQIFHAPLRRMTAESIVTVADVKCKVDSHGYFGWLSGLLAFWFFLLMWQRIRTVLLRLSSWMVFMDKICVNQTDPVLKEKGILGLAGFLAISDRIVILWSPRYFSRLWCVYEIATWMKLRKPLNKILMVPVAQGNLVWCVQCGLFPFLFIVVWIAREEDWTHHSIMAAAALACYLPGAHIIRQLVQDLALLPKQISGFNFDDAECFCCSVDHRLQSDGKTICIPCDRLAVKEKLDEWFEDDPSGAPAVEQFNSFVHEELGCQILKWVGGSRVRYNICMLASSPGLFWIADRFYQIHDAGLKEGGGELAARLIMHYATFAFCAIPCTLRIALWANVLIQTTCGTQKALLPNLLLTSASALAAVCPTLGILFALYETLALKPLWPQICVTVAVVVCTALLFKHSVLELLEVFRSYLPGSAPVAPAEISPEEDEMPRRHDQKHDQKWVVTELDGPQQH